MPKNHRCKTFILRHKKWTQKIRSINEISTKTV